MLSYIARASRMRRTRSRSDFEINRKNSSIFQSSYIIDIISFGKISRSARHGADLHRAIGTIRIDVERTRRALDDFARDHDFFHAFKARKVEHGLEQDAFEYRPQAAGAGLALDRFACDR